MEAIILFGTGDRGRRLSALFAHYGIEIKYWLDSDAEKWDTQLNGKPIYPPEKVQEDRSSPVCIAAVDAKGEMRRTLLEYGVEESRIHTFSDVVSGCLFWYFPWEKQGRMPIPPYSGLSGYSPREKQREEKRRQKILLDCSNGLGLGGVEAWSISLLQGLRRLDREAYLLSPRGSFKVGEEIRRRTLWVDTRPENLFSPENLEQIAGALQRQLPCVFITSSINDMLLAACSLKMRYPKQVRILAVIHQGLPGICREYAGLDGLIEAYIAVSRDIQAEMARYGIQSSKLLHMTCPTECITPYRRTYRLDRGEPIRIGYAGRIEAAQKRLDRLVEVLKGMEERGTNYRMEIAGEGSYWGPLAEQLQRHGFRDKVSLIGRIDRAEIPGFWARQDICVNLSDFEGRSISVMEAMRNGAVPVVTATSGVGEDIRDGFNGYIIEPGEYAAMAERIDSLEKNRELLRIYGERSHEIMGKKGNMDTHMEFWNEVLRADFV